ncbi:MAG: hypothetical protein A2083_02065 [Gemmatimonadetes bacterium GWC2_71_9]|nr:MAG: hypothetical protein A2083_02065 [Gemmatimonadetes bacterium GWC2_71_9]
MALQVAVELGLAVLVEAERGVELPHRLDRHQRPQERDRFGRPPDLRKEVGAREAEDDAHVGLGEQDRIHRHAPRAVDERQHDRHHPVAAPHAPHQVGALAAVEDRLEHLEVLV